jgi:uncharacterized cofD-like protein
MQIFKGSKKIICLGGGTAMPRVVLSELKKTKHKIAVISAVLDSGGSAGKLREDYHTVSFGDIRRSFLELVDWPKEIKEYFKYRFEKGCLDGHVLANIMLSALYLKDKSYRNFFEKINELLPVRHRILPATITNSHLHVLLENGEEIIKESNIDVPKHNSDLKIKKIFLVPEAEACPITLRNLENADVIIIGPGDLYSSLLQILLIKGMSEAIINSRAKKIFICNLMTKKGESNNYNVLDFTKEIERYLGGSLDYVIYNNYFPDERIVSAYKANHPELIEMVKIKEDLDKKKFIGSNLLEKNGILDHNPIKLYKEIIKLI